MDDVEAQIQELELEKQIAALEAEKQAATQPTQTPKTFIGGAIDAITAPLQLVGSALGNTAGYLVDSAETGNWYENLPSMPDVTNPDVRDALIRVGADVAGGAGGLVAGLAAAPMTWGTSAVAGPALGPVVAEEGLEAIGLLNPEPVEYKLGGAVGDALTMGAGKAIGAIGDVAATRFGNLPNAKQIEQLATNPSAASELAGISRSSQAGRLAADKLDENLDAATNDNFFGRSKPTFQNMALDAESNAKSALQAKNAAMQEARMAMPNIDNAAVKGSDLAGHPAVVALQEKIKQQLASPDMAIKAEGQALLDELNNSLTWRDSNIATLESDIKKMNAQLRINKTFDKSVITPSEAAKQARENEVYSALLQAKKEARDAILHAASPEAAQKYINADIEYGRYSDLSEGFGFAAAERSKQAASAGLGASKSDVVDGVGAGIRASTSGGITGAIGSLVSSGKHWLMGTSKEAAINIGLQQKGQEAADLISKMQRYKAGRLQNQPNPVISTAGAGLEYAAMSAAMVPNTLSIEEIMQQPEMAANMIFQGASVPLPGEEPALAQQRAGAMAQDFMQTVQNGTDYEIMQFIAHAQNQGLLPPSAIKGSVSKNGMTYIPLPEDRQKFVESRKMDLSNGSLSKAEYYAQLNAMSDASNGKVIESIKRQKAALAAQMPQQPQVVQNPPLPRLP